MASTVAAGRWPAPARGTLGCQGVWAPTAAGLPGVAPVHPSAPGGAASRRSACRAPSQCQATTVPPHNRAALPRNASRRLTPASTPLSIGLTAEPICAPLCKTPKALARWATGITDAPRPYANVRRRCLTGVDLVVYGYLECCSSEEEHACHHCFSANEQTNNSETSPQEDIVSRETTKSNCEEVS